MSATPKTGKANKPATPSRHPDADASLVFTKFTSNSPLSKKIELVDGKMHKSANAQMYTGMGERMSMSIEGFAAEMDKAGPNVAFGYGTFGEAFKDTVSIATKGMLDTRRKKSPDGPNTISRTKDYFSFPQAPGILMLDNDYTAQGMLMGPDRMLAVLRDDLGLSGIGECSYLHRGSASSGVFLVEDEGPKPGRGFHLYVAVSDASDIARAGKVLFKRLWLLEKGYGFINLSISGAMLVRGIIDDAVFSPERLDFVGRPVIEGGGLAYKEPDITTNAGRLFDTTRIKSLNKKEEAKFAELVEAAKRDKKPESEKLLKKWARPLVDARVAAGMDRKAAQLQVEAIGRGETHDLPDNWIVTFADKALGSVTIGEILKDTSSMRKYDGKAMADPLEGTDYGESTAIFYANFKGKDDGVGDEDKAMPFINSFAHGQTRYFPKTREQTEASGSGKPVIRIIGGSLPENVTDGEKALIDAGEEIYQQGPKLVRPARSKKAAESQGKGGKGVQIPDGTIYLESVDKVWVREALTKHAQWMVFDARAKGFVRKDCPAAVAETLVARVGQWNVPPLAGLSACPTMDLKTGRVIAKNGYDDRTGIYVAYDGPAVEMLEALEGETGLEVAGRAVKMLLRPLAGFPFVTMGGKNFDRSVALSAILTATVRKGLETAPLHAFDATTRGSGKGLLASLVSIIATGSRPPMINTGHTEEETEKRMIALALMGLPVVCLDNVAIPLGGDILCSLLTETSVMGRVLGKSEQKALHSSCMFLVTGNNLRLKEDLARRALRCKIDPEMERPEERKFPDMPDLRGWAAKERGRLLGAALSLLREYGKAGKPKPEGYTRVGSFEDWSDEIRAALIWAGEDDPYGNHREVDSADPVFTYLGEFHAAWRQMFKEGGSLNVSDILKAAQGSLGGENKDERIENPLCEPLQEAIIGLTNRHRGIEFVSTKVLSDTMRIHSGRVIDNLRIVPIRDTKANSIRWSVLEVKK
jgi:hypothetical protein